MFRKISKLKKAEVRSLLSDIFWPKGFSAKMGRIIGALSILALLNNSIQFGLSRTLYMLLSYYNEFVNFLFTWAEPTLHNLAQYFSSLVKLNIILNSIWHHVFVLMWILFMRDAYVAYVDGRKNVGIARGVTGFLISVIFSLIASIEISQLSIPIKNVQLATVPYIGIYLYDLIMYAYSAYLLRQSKKPSSKTKLLSKRKRSNIEKWEYFKRNSVRAHWRFVIVLVAILACFIITSLLGTPYPKGGFIILTIATIVNLSYWIVRGNLYARNLQRKDGLRNTRSWYSLFMESEAGRFSLAVGSVIFWALAFIVLNTGAKILGL